MSLLDPQNYLDSLDTLGESSPNKGPPGSDSDDDGYDSWDSEPEDDRSSRRPSRRRASSDDMGSRTGFLASLQRRFSMDKSKSRADSSSASRGHESLANNAILSRRLKSRTMLPRFPRAWSRTSQNSTATRRPPEQSGGAAELRMEPPRSVQDELLDVVVNSLRRQWMQLDTSVIRINNQDIDLEEFKGNGSRTSRRGNRRSLAASADGEDQVSRLGRDFLLQCLRVRLWDAEAASATALRFLRFRCAVDWPFAIQPSEVARPLSSGMHILLPGRDRKGRGILTHHPRVLDETLCSVEEYQKMACYLVQEANRDPEVQDCGMVIILDASGTSLGTLAQYSYEDVRRGALMLHCYPCRLKHTYIVNSSTMIGSAIQLILSMMKPKVRERVTFVSPDFSELHAGIHPSELPPEFGGTLQWDWTDWVTARLKREGKPMSPNSSSRLMSLRRPRSKSTVL